jgi:hypothetical protein
MDPIILGNIINKEKLPFKEAVFLRFLCGKTGYSLLEDSVAMEKGH